MSGARRARSTRFPNDAKTYEFTASDLTELDCIGTGRSVMAVKRVRAHEIDTTKREQMLRELRIIIESQHCEDVVRFFGALFQDVICDCWICMELWDCSLDKFFGGFGPARICENLRLWYKRLLSRFHCQNQDVGCQIYMAPERLSDRVYGTRSDVWSLGISLVEICIGRFPYVDGVLCLTNSKQLCMAILPFSGGFLLLDLVDFVNKCLIKETSSRPKYTELMEHNFFKKNNVLDADRMLEERSTFGSYVARFPSD
uniref:mitogen-activated protein kinase kinase n=1 Tax=Ditylenchus dipsaci TaxID=166011 RepID=A0A915EQF3_9BILA